MIERERLLKSMREQIRWRTEHVGAPGREFVFLIGDTTLAILTHMEEANAFLGIPFLIHPQLPDGLALLVSTEVRSKEKRFL